MKRTLLALGLIFLIGITAIAQNEEDGAPYKKVPYVPPIDILLTDSSFFTKKDLPTKTPIVVIWFSPDCSHCQLETKDIIDSMEYFKKAFFVFASYKKLPEIAEFSDKYKLNDFNNIKIGRDTAYFLATFYRVRFTPFIAVYDEEGNLLKTFPKGASVEELKTLLYDRKKKKKAAAKKKS